MAREDTMFARGDFAGEFRRIEAAEKKLVPLATKITVAMKIKAEDRAAEIRGNAGGKSSETLRRMGRDALNARAALRNTTRDLKLHRTLADDALSQLDVATAAVNAQAKRDEKARLLAKAEEIKGALGFVTSLFEKAAEFDPDKLEITDATLAGLGIKLVSWGLHALSGADKLIERANELEKEAATIDVDNLKKTLQRTTKLVRELAKASKVWPRLWVRRQELSPAERRGGGRLRRKPKEEEDDVQVRRVRERSGADSCDRRNARRDDSRSGSTHRRQAAGGNCAGEPACVRRQVPHSSRQGSEVPETCKPDPATVQKETLEMKAIVKAGVAEIAADKKLLERGLIGVKMAASDANDRQQAWAAYLEQAQTALFSAPEPPGKGR